MINIYRVKEHTIQMHDMYQKHHEDISRLQDEMNSMALDLKVNNHFLVKYFLSLKENIFRVNIHAKWPPFDMWEKKIFI